MSMETTVKKLKKGEYFTIKNIENPTENQVFIRSTYNMMLKKYLCGCANDISGYRHFEGDRIVYTEFNY